MKAEFPKLISAVRIEGLDLGQNPFKIVKVKRLDPDQPIAEGHDPGSDSSRHVNLEIHFAYQGEERASATVGPDLQYRLSWDRFSNTLQMCGISKTFICWSMSPSDSKVYRPSRFQYLRSCPQLRASCGPVSS